MKRAVILNKKTFVYKGPAHPAIAELFDILEERA